MKIVAFLFACGVLISSCSKDKEIINNPPVADFSYVDEVYRIKLTATATDIDNDELTYSWDSDILNVILDNANSKRASFNIPEVPYISSVQIRLIVCDQSLCDTIVKTIQLPELTELRKYGLGIELKSEKSNNVDYEWYIDQMNTGINYEYNDAPSVAIMALKWYDEDFNITTDYYINTYPCIDGWWDVNDLNSFIVDYTKTERIIAIDNSDDIIEEINKGNILIICLDMFYIPYHSGAELRIGSFNYFDQKGYGHVAIIKGYKNVDERIYFEMYDPMSFGARYIDNTLKGKDRYYLSSDVDSATNNWWDKAIVVSKK